MNAWGKYVERLRAEREMTQTAFAEEALGSQSGQGKISEWIRGMRPPTDAAVVADFARRLGRNPIEAFVAAGMLRLEEAQNAITEEEVEFLRKAGALPRTRGVRVRKSPSPASRRQASRSPSK